MPERFVLLITNLEQPFGIRQPKLRSREGRGTVVCSFIQTALGILPESSASDHPEAGEMTPDRRPDEAAGLVQAAHTVEEAIAATTRALYETFSPLMVMVQSDILTPLN
jgi:hypothetical protein